VQNFKKQNARPNPLTPIGASFGAISSGTAAQQPSLTVISILGKIVEEAVELAGHVGVIERDGVGVVA
jgi:hypothetical protein